MYSTASPSSPSSCSSPPSSPAPYLDSSPASSPDFHGFIQVLDDDLPEFSLSHPYAASAKPNWRPPQYEKKRLTSPSTLEDQPFIKKLKHGTNEPMPLVDHDALPVRTPQQIEADIWDEASTKVVDEGHGAVDLDNRNLTSIPETFIIDLSNFYIPPESCEVLNSSPKLQITAGGQFTRVATAPSSSSTPGGARLFSRSRSAATASFGLPREKLQLFLSSNRISVLPLQLLTLQNLSVLSIRGNLITHVPPEIIGLKNLTTLNIASNQIKFLPAEILQMQLTQLQLFPNPFIKPPPSSDKRIQINPWKDAQNNRQVSDTKHLLPKILPLTEISLRILFSPAAPENPGETRLEAYYDLPLDECPLDLANPSSTSTPSKRHFPFPIPSHLRHVLDTCVPYSVYRDKETFLDPVPPESNITGIGLCQSPKHHQSGKAPVFVYHAEQRFSWERIIANVNVGEAVPVQWRGCQRGCLDFLDGIEQDDPEQPAEEVDWSLGNGLKEDTEMEDVIQVVQFGASGAGGLDDFDD